MFPPMDFFESANFKSRVDDLMEKHHVPGLAIALVLNETVVSAGYGQQSLDPPKECTADTLFDIASASKSLTAASVGLLVADNEAYPEVQYEATMSSLLPDDFVMPEATYTDGVTVEDILSHRSGMAPHDFSYLGVRAAQPDDARSVTRNLRNLPVAAPIRSKYMYCNMMFTVATHLVECKTGLSFSRFLHQNFFQPLGMQSTSLQPEEARACGLSDRISPGHTWDKDGQKYKVFETPDAPDSQGAGCIITSVNDYIKWVKALMNHEGPITQDVYLGLIKSRSFQNPSGEHLDPFTSPIAYGAGLEVFYYRGHMVVGHDGCVDGFASRHFWLPELKFGAVILGNSEGTGYVAKILSQELIDRMFQVPQGERPDWDRIQAEADAQDDDICEIVDKLMQKLCPGITERQPQEKPLGDYVGEYSHPGYHGLTVEIKDGHLFIDATDRTFGFTFKFDHVCEQTKYIAHFCNFLDGTEGVFMAEFKFEGQKVSKLGVNFESELKDLIWFDRVMKGG